MSVVVGIDVLDENGLLVREFAASAEDAAQRFADDVGGEVVVIREEVR